MLPISSVRLGRTATHDIGHWLNLIHIGVMTICQLGVYAAARTNAQTRQNQGTTRPDPSDYASFGADQAHFCLLARIETSATAPFGMTSPESENLYANVQSNNDIVWKNISIVDTDGAGARVAAVVIRNLSRDRKKMRLIFETPKRRGASLFDWGHLLVDFRGKALTAWARTT